MFPTGTAGAALLVLRASVATALVVDATTHVAPTASPWALIAAAIPAALLCFGFLTPYCAVLCCLIELSLLLIFRGPDSFHLALATLNGGILAVLGPGAYSIDARIFGRKLLSFPTHR